MSKTVRHSQYSNSNLTNGRSSGSDSQARESPMRLRAEHFRVISEPGEHNVAPGRALLSDFQAGRANVAPGKAFPMYFRAGRAQCGSGQSDIQVNKIRSVPTPKVISNENLNVAPGKAFLRYFRAGRAQGGSGQSISEVFPSRESPMWLRAEHFRGISELGEPNVAPGRAFPRFGRAGRAHPAY